MLVHEQFETGNKQMHIRDYLKRVDAGVAHEIEIIFPNKIKVFRVFSVQPDGRKKYVGIYEEDGVAKLKSYAKNIKGNPIYAVREFQLADYKAKVPINENFDVLDLHVSTEHPSFLPIQNSENYSSLMNWAFESGLLPIKDKTELWVSLSPKWYAFLEKKANAIESRDLFSEFLKEYNQLTGIFRPARIPSLKPSIKERISVRINNAAKPIKKLIGLKANDNILISIFIGVAIGVLTVLVLYGIGKAVGLKFSDFY